MTLSRALRIFVAIALTAYVLLKADPAAIARVAARADPSWLAAAIVLVVVDRAVNAYRWLILLRALSTGTRPPLGAVMRIFFVSSFVGNFLPSIGGDVYRAYQLARLGVRSGEAAASVMMDRMIGVLSMAMVAACALLFLPAIDLPGVVPALIVVGLACAMAAVGVFSGRVAEVAVRTAERLPWARVRRLTRTVVDAVRRYGQHQPDLVGVLGLSIGVQILRVVQAYFLGRALAIDQPLLAYFVCIPVTTLIMQLPITVAGLGTTQYAFERLFGYVRVPAPEAVALSILFLALGTIGNLPGGALYLFGQAATPGGPARHTPTPEEDGLR